MKMNYRKRFSIKAKPALQKKKKKKNRKKIERASDTEKSSVDLSFDSIVSSNYFSINRCSWIYFDS